MRILNVLRTYVSLGHEQRSSVVAKYDELTGNFIFEFSSQTGQTTRFTFDKEQTAQLKEAINGS